MRQAVIYRILVIWGIAFWIAGGALFADDTIELGTYYPSQEGDMNSVGVKESLILDPQTESPGNAANMPGTLYYDKANAGLYFSDGTQWRSIATRSVKDNYKVTMEKLGAQVESNAGVQPYRKSTTASKNLSIPFWTLTTDPTSLSALPDPLITTYKTDGFKQPFAVKIDLRHHTTFYSILWGGSISVDGINSPTKRMGVSLYLQVSNDGAHWKKLDQTLPCYDASPPVNGTFTPCPVGSDHDPSEPRSTEWMTPDNKLYQYFRILVVRDSLYDTEVIAKVENQGLWFVVTKENG